MRRDDTIYIAGHRGLVGSSIVRRLRRAGCEDLLLRTSDELDLTRQADVEDFFAEEHPACVFLAAAKVGGILANDRHPADFIRINLQIQSNVIAASHRFGVEKLLFLGSSCIYPRHASQPMREESLLTGPLEPTNDAYAVAKIAGIMMCNSYRRQHGARFVSAMPTNLYGPGDNFDVESSHVVPAMIRKFHEATRRGGPVELWGTGAPRRELLFIDDLAEALVLLMERYEGDDPQGFVNVGTGEDVTIRELADLVARVTGYEGEIVWDSEKPDGTPRKLLDVSRIRSLGWSPSTDLAQGLEETWAWYKENVV